MCNLYSETKGQAAIRALFHAAHDRTGNLQRSLGSSPTRLRQSSATTRMVSANCSWRAGACRNHRRLAASPSPTSATCRVPAGSDPETAASCHRPSFCEYADTKPRKTPTWFALSEDRPLFAFAGLWTPWRGVRGPKSAPVEGEHELFGFLTTEPNAIVASIHPKAMPAEEFDLWLESETAEALKLQRPLPDGMLDIVARGAKEDPPIESLAVAIAT